mmetsp:Transcript_508/g.1460  ORF Transcript_508/g.1460 Transcript_508/m.1460 type:complete len:218 (-) Transcript_508:585-1238(-)
MTHIVAEAMVAERMRACRDHRVDNHEAAEGADELVACVLGLELLRQNPSPAVRVQHNGGPAPDRGTIRQRSALLVISATIWRSRRAGNNIIAIAFVTLQRARSVVAVGDWVPRGGGGAVLVRSMHIGAGIVSRILVSANAHGIPSRGSIRRRRPSAVRLGRRRWESQACRDYIGLCTGNPKARPNNLGVVRDMGGGSSGRLVIFGLLPNAPLPTEKG